jgi:hypothetical protein
VASFADAVADLMTAPKSGQSKASDDMYERGTPVGPSPDLDRILALPRRQPVDLESTTAQAIVELEMRIYGRDNSFCNCRKIAPHRNCITRLLPVQAWALREIRMAQGMLANITVGGGKTIIGILAALALRDCPRPLMLIPPTLVDQILVDYQLLREHFIVPGMIIHAGEKSPPSSLVDGMPTLNVLPYSRLSLPDSSDMLARLDPSAIIADECDALKDRTASRTMRLLKHFSGDPDMKPELKAHRRKTKFCGWTGSLTDHSINEFAHLALLALREKSPVPMDKIVAEEWSKCLDPSDWPSPPGELLKLCEPGEDVRHAFRRRISETLGFIVSTGSTVIQAGSEEKEVDIVIREKEAPPLPQIIQDALAKVRMFQRPDTLVGSYDDEELTDIMAQARCAQEVASGVFYRWKFPPRNGVPQEEATVREWYAARKLWNREVRLKSQQGEMFLDSPMLCEHAAMRAWGDAPKRNDRPEWKADHWPRWRDVKDKVYYEQEAKWLDDYLAKDAAEWALENRGIVWYGMAEFGRGVARLSGLPLHTGGQGAGERLRAETGKHSIIASIKSHGRGRDGLQHIFDHQLIVQTMSSATGFEQLLGRAHRRGQKSDVVTTEIYLHTPELRKAFEQALNRSNFVRDIMGSNYKLTKGWQGM